MRVYVCFYVLYAQAALIESTIKESLQGWGDEDVEEQLQQVSQIAVYVRMYVCMYVCVQ